MKNLFFLLGSLMMLTVSEHLHAFEHTVLTSIVKGDRIVQVNVEAKDGSSVVSFTTYNQSMVELSVTEIVVQGINAKLCLAKGIYSPYSTNELMLIEVVLKESMMAKTGVTLGVSPDFEVKWRHDLKEENYSKKRAFDEDFFRMDTPPVYPTDHVNGNIGVIRSMYYEQDASTIDGGLVYLWHNIEEVGMDVESRKYDSEINSALFYYSLDNGVITKKWSFNLEEERILSYKVCLFGEVGFLFTSYQAGNQKIKTGEKYEARLRMFDLKSGQVIWNVLLPGKEGFEACYSNMTHDSKTGDVYVAFNSVLAQPGVNNKVGDAVNTQFTMVKVNGAGQLTSAIREMKWEASEIAFRHSSFPLFLVKNIDIESGSPRVTGVFIFWRENAMNANTYPVGMKGGSMLTAPYVQLAVVGIETSVLDADLKVVLSKQYAFDPAPKDDDMFSLGAGGNLRRALMSGSYFYDSQLASETYWNPVTRTLTIVQLSGRSEPFSKDRTVFALKLVEGTEKFFKSIGQMRMMDAIDISYRFHAVVTDGSLIYYSGSNGNNIKHINSFLIPS